MHRVNTQRGSKHKPSKGMKMQMAQNRRAQLKRKAMQKAKEARAQRRGIGEATKAYIKKITRWFQLSRHLRGKHTPHQGPKEMERRVRQRREGKCINPVDYPHGPQEA